MQPFCKKVLQYQFICQDNKTVFFISSTASVPAYSRSPRESINRSQPAEFKSASGSIDDPLKYFEAAVISGEPFASQDLQKP
jgi:hypothetical protein